MTGSTSAIGYHGTSKSAVDSILDYNLIQSDNPYDWLGIGFYFFQDAPVRAKIWAVERKTEPAVIGAVISLENCIDLLDIDWWDTLTKSHDFIKRKFEREHKPMPTQMGGRHNLDKTVLDYVVDKLENQGIHYNSIRAIFREGDSPYPGSDFRNLDHVQIAVRSKDAILKIWEHLP